jgi:hypothetical protein
MHRTIGHIKKIATLMIVVPVFMVAVLAMPFIYILARLGIPGFEIEYRDDTSDA